jgi:hypothetical protein
LATSSEVSCLKNEIGNLKLLLKSYEDQNLKLAELEKKLKTQNLKHDSEMKLLQDNYKMKIKHLTKKLFYYETIAKNNNNGKNNNFDNSHIHKKNSLIDEDELDRTNVK